MDLGRWNLKGLKSLQKLTNISDRYRGLHQLLGDVLEGERPILSPERSPGETAPATSLPFRVRDDIESVLEAVKTGSRSKTMAVRPLLSKRAETVFGKLSEHFEAGFYFEKHKNGEPRLKTMFLFGRLFHPQDDGETEVPFVIPTVGPERVLKVAARPVLNAFRLEEIEKLRDANAFLFEPKDGVVFLLICDRPHPWQVGHIERAHEVLKKAFEAQPPKKGAIK